MGNEVSVPAATKSPLHGWLTTVLDALYPPQCVGCLAPTEAAHGLCPDCWRETAFLSGTLCDSCAEPLPGDGDDDGPVHCDTCLADPPAWRRGRAAVAYSGTGRRVVLSLKHGDRLDLARPLAGWMQRAGADVLTDADLLAPVPLHWLRFFRRKSNQSAELARRLSALTDRPAVPDLVIRRRPTRSQDGLDRAERRTNQTGAFDVPERHKTLLRGRTVCLIDDVLTTGATLNACAAALTEAGASQIDVLVVARVAKPR